MNDDVFRFCDTLGPQRIVHVHEPAIGLKAILVVDNVAAGPSIGGLRSTTWPPAPRSAGCAWRRTSRSRSACGWRAR